jgi:hypothetical protein
MFAPHPRGLVQLRYARQFAAHGAAIGKPAVARQFRQHAAVDAVQPVFHHQKFRLSLEMTAQILVLSHRRSSLFGSFRKAVHDSDHA